MITPYNNIIKTGRGAFGGFLVVFTILLMAGPVRAGGVKWGGEFESEIYANDRWGDPQLGSINSFTLLGDAEINDHTSFHSRLIFRHLTGYKIIDEVTQILIDRAQVNLYLEKFDLIIGKQRLAWGSGYAFNPTDVFNPPDFTDPRGEREGVSAVRLTVPLGKVSEVMLVGAQKAAEPVYDSGTGKWTTPSDKAEDGEYAVLAKTNFADYDLSLIAIDLGKDESEKLGGSVSGELFGLGVWLEGAYTFPEDEKKEIANKNNYPQVVAGLDYTFQNGLYLLGEYYRNEQGAWSYKDYQWARLRRGEITNPGRDYLFNDFEYDVTDLTKIVFSSLLNVNDSSFFFHPQINYNIYSDTTISGGMYGFYGPVGSEFFGEKNSVKYHNHDEYFLTFLVHF